MHWLAIFLQILRLRCDEEKYLDRFESLKYFAFIQFLRTAHQDYDSCPISPNLQSKEYSPHLEATSKNYG